MSVSHPHPMLTRGPEGIFQFPPPFATLPKASLNESTRDGVFTPVFL